MLALPIFPGRRQPSIVGAGELNCRVRNGNGWTLTAINTNYSISTDPSVKIPLYYSTLITSCQETFGDPYRIRTDVKGVRGLCLNHLTNGPCPRSFFSSLQLVYRIRHTSQISLVHLQGLEPGTH